MELSIIIPVYNEEENIDPLYEELHEVLSSLGRSHEILFVDDGSTDTTWSHLTKLHERDPAVTLIRFRSNFGQSAAMKAGFDHARGDLIITMDADLQNDPHDIPDLLTDMETEDLDVVCGWRFNRQDNISKKLFSKVANTLRSWLTSEIIHDSGCTLRLYTRESISDIELYGELHRYIPAILLWKGYHVGETKINHRKRIYGTTKYSWHRIIKGFLDLLVITFWHKYSVRPMHIFGGTGIIMSTVGLIITLYLGVDRIFCGTALTNRPLFLAALVLLIIGLQFIALGILADILLKIYYSQNTRKPYLVEKVVEGEARIS